jgi:carbamoyl-phosphate synthase large subunit
MNILLSCIGRRGYIAKYFRDCLTPQDLTIGTGNSEWTSGFKYCDVNLILPDLDTPEYIPTLLQICRDRKIDAIISFSDLDINILSGCLDLFKEIGVIPIIPSPAANQICFDKYQGYQFLTKEGFATPQTYSDFNLAVEDIKNGKQKFPLIVKPRFGSGSQNLFKARNIKELDVFFHYAPNMLIQAEISGQEYGIDVCLNLQGEVISVVPRRKIAMRSGETDQAEICDRPDLIDLGISLGTALGKLGHVGPLDVDFLDNSEKVFAIDLNPRFGGGYPISHLAGANFPGLLLRIIQGEKIDSQIGNYQKDIVMMKEYSIIGGKQQDILRATQSYA